MRQRVSQTDNELVSERVSQWERKLESNWVWGLDFDIALALSLDLAGSWFKRDVNAVIDRSTHGISETWIAPLKIKAESWPWPNVSERRKVSFFPQSDRSSLILRKKS